MIIFGGRNLDHDIVNETWIFNLQTYHWHFIHDTIDTPLARCGHSAVLYKDTIMLVFGGIHEVTKELNDMYAFDIKAKKWILLFEDQASTGKFENKYRNHFSPESPPTPMSLLLGK